MRRAILHYEAADLDTVWSIATVKAHSDMDDACHESMKKTRVESHEVAKKLGQVEECPVHRGEAFIKKWGAEDDKTMTRTAQHDD